VILPTKPLKTGGHRLFYGGGQRVLALSVHFFHVLTLTGDEVSKALIGEKNE
jgi:hypothetical protein